MSTTIITFKNEDITSAEEVEMDLINKGLEAEVSESQNVIAYSYDTTELVKIIEYAEHNEIPAVIAEIR